MKILVLILIMAFLLPSCGPHRMRCGAKGICISKEPAIPFQSKSNTKT